MSSPRSLALRVAALVLGGYLVARGVAEFFVVDVGDPTTYRQDWGGPSLAGVLAVHVGPAVVVAAWTGYRLSARTRSAR